VFVKAATANAATLLGVVRKSANVAAVKSDVKRPFRFLLCGDPGLVAEFRMLLLWARPDQNVPDDAVATLETIDPERWPTVAGPDVRAIIFLGRPGDTAGARLDLLQPLRLPIFALTVDGITPPAQQPLAAPSGGQIAEYVVARLDRESLRGRLFPHLIERCKGIEIAVGRRLPALRETVVSKLTRDAASSALKVSAASAVVDNVPLLGIVLGMVVSAGDMVAITGIQVVLMMQIGAIYGKDPDVGRVWDMLPVVGGGLGWRALSRELAGFVPVAGVAIKGAIAYAGTIVVGEGAGFFYEHGYHMTKTQAGQLYEEKKRSALAFARDLIGRLKGAKP
jgi:uncharacterized protein (DUF697 family)